MIIVDGLTNVVVYNCCVASRRCSSRAAFRVLGITSVGILTPIMAIIHSYMKADKKHCFPRME